MHHAPHREGAPHKRGVLLGAAPSLTCAIMTLTTATRETDTMDTSSFENERIKAADRERLRREQERDEHELTPEAQGFLFTIAVAIMALLISYFA